MRLRTDITIDNDFVGGAAVILCILIFLVGAGQLISKNIDADSETRIAEVEACADAVDEENDIDDLRRCLEED